MREKKFSEISTYALKHGWELISPISAHYDKPLLWKNTESGLILKKRWETVRRTGFKIGIGANQHNPVLKNYRQDVDKICALNNIEIISCPSMVSSKTKLVLKDSMGVFETTFYRLSKIRFPRRTKRTIEQLKRLCEKKGGKCLSEKYIGPHAKYLFEDSRGRRWTATANSIWAGSWSPFEAKEKLGAYNRLATEDVLDRIKDLGFKYLSGEYKNAKSKLEISCKNGHIWATDIDHLMQGNGCPNCSNRTSNAELELLNWVLSLSVEAKKVIVSADGKRKECDVFIPSKNTGIEYNGLYWHSDKAHNNFKNIFDKTVFFQKRNIQIIHIFEDEWLERKDQVKNLIASKIAPPIHRIDARNCVVKEISKKEAKNFINTNHIQKINHMVLAIGIFHKENLVGVTSFSRHHRKTKDRTIVLSRMCFSYGVSIRGGASKMFSFFKKNFKNEYDRVISWSDNRFGVGSVYQSMGFTREKELPPDYYYVKKQKRIHKQLLKKDRLLKKGAVGKTELEMASSLGYHRIYDCGKIRWSFDLTTKGDKNGTI